MQKLQQKLWELFGIVFLKEKKRSKWPHIKNLGLKGLTQQTDLKESFSPCKICSQCDSSIPRVKLSFTLVNVVSKALARVINDS